MSTQYVQVVNSRIDIYHHIIHDPNQQVLDLLCDINQRLDQILNKESQMADALQEAFDALSTEVAEVGTVDTAVSTELQSLAAQIQAIQPGTTLTAEQIAGLATTLTSATSKLKEAATAAQPPVAPVTPSEPPAEAPPTNPVTPAV